MGFGKFCTIACLFTATFPAYAGVYVTSPSQATVSTSGTASSVSPVHFVAQATSPACSKGVATIGIYTAPYTLAYSVGGATLDTNLSLSAGTYSVAVQEWDYCGWSSKALLTLTVTASSGSTGSATTPGTTFYGLENQKGWSGYALLPPSWGICSTCSSSGPELAWSWKPTISSPSLDGQSTQSSYGGGSVQWGDVLWNNHIVGSFSSQGLPDYKHTLVPTLHNFTYDVYFWVKDASVSQALEFDINQFTGGHSFIWGHECRIAGGSQWDVYDNVHKKWVPTGVPCNPVSGAWNHLIISVQRTSNNQLLYKSITLNGKTATLNHSEAPGTSSWNGVTINYQLDGNRYGTPYSVYLDKLNFTMQ
ncbi:MAG TPA: hypothetical protein VL156_20475 [Terriglobales bacterium]|jgi:hypothetical protein|nr:hypothetical protein [Terriglobales bacterium]